MDPDRYRVLGDKIEQTDGELRQELRELRQQVGQMQQMQSAAAQYTQQFVPPHIMVAMSIINRFQQTTFPQVVGCPYDGEVEIIERPIDDDEIVLFRSACDLLSNFCNIHNPRLVAANQRERVPHPETVDTSSLCFEVMA